MPSQIPRRIKQVFAVLAGANFLDAASTWPRGMSSRYFLAQAAILVVSGIWMFAERRALIQFGARCRAAWWRLPMPRGIKAIALLVGALQSVHVIFGFTNYPFADVGMFRGAVPNRPLDPVLGRHKYFFRDEQGQIRLFDIRRQHLEAPWDLMGWGWNNELTYSLTFHFQHRPRNYHYILQALAEKRGATALSVGLQTVDFRTGKVEFFTDPAIVFGFANVYAPLWDPVTQSWNIPHAR